MLKYFAVLVILSCCESSFAIKYSPLRKVYPIWEPLPVEGDVGEALFLTPLIEAGNIQEAQDLAKVGNISEIPSYSGFLTVNPDFNSNLFFWFFPAEVSLAHEE